MDLDITVLRAFVRVAELQSFSRAADQLYRVQSGISQQIKKLETLLGVELFDRSRRHVELTDYGRTFLPHAKRMLVLNEDSIASVQTVQGPMELKLGITDTLASCFLKTLLLKSAYEHPSLRIEIVCGYSPMLWQEFSDGVLDVVIAQGCPDGLNSELLYVDSLEWIIHSSSTVHRDGVLPMAVFTEGCSDRKVTLEALDRSGRSYVVKLSSRSHSAILAGVDTGLMLCTMLRSAITDEGKYRYLSVSDGLPALDPVYVAMAARPGESDAPCQIFARTVRSFFSGFSSNDVVYSGLTKRRSP